MSRSATRPRVFRSSPPLVAIIVTLVCAVAFLAPAAIAGDRVVMKSGAIFRGKVVEQTRDELIMDITGLGRVRLIRDRILDIEIEGEAAPAPEPLAAPVAEAQPPTESAPEPEPEAPARASFDIPWEKLFAGQRALVLLAGEDHGDWLETGARYLAEVRVVTPNRLKIVFDPEGGPLGNAWVPRDRIQRIVNPGAANDRLLLFLEDVDVGAWIRCRTGDGRMLAGRFASFSDAKKLTLRIPHAAGIESVELTLADLTVLEAVVRRPALIERVESLRPGEPVGLVVNGRSRPITGRLLGAEEDHLLVAVADENGKPERPVRIYVGCPIVSVARLPDYLRAAFEDSKPGDRIEIFRVTEDEAETVRTRVEGKLVHATPESILLDTIEGTVTVTVNTMKRARRLLGEDDSSAALRKPDSDAECKLTVLPGQDEAAAKAALPANSDGIDVLYGPEGVEKVYCRPPFVGPVFGIRLGVAFETQLENTDLVFQEWRTPKTGGDLALTTVTSRTLTPYIVTFLLSADGIVLAAEISAR